MACSSREREGCVNDAWNIVARFVDPFPASSSDELDDHRRRPNEMPDISSATTLSTVRHASSAARVVFTMLEPKSGRRALTRKLPPRVS